VQVFRRDFTGDGSRQARVAPLMGDLYHYLYMYEFRRTPMDAIPYTRLRSNLASEMDRVCEDHAPIIVTRKASSSVVMISLDDYEALEETSYLLRSPKNARRLLKSVDELEAGNGSEKELAE
jgi:antitoxin YefM